MHWLLCPGPYNLVTFGELAADEIHRLNYCVIPKTVLVESPGLYVGDFETRVQRDSRGDLSQAADFVEQFLTMKEAPDNDLTPPTVTVETPVTPAGLKLIDP